MLRIRLDLKRTSKKFYPACPCPQVPVVHVAAKLPSVDRLLCHSYKLQTMIDPKVSSTMTDIRIADKGGTERFLLKSCSYELQSKAITRSNEHSLGRTSHNNINRLQAISASFLLSLPVLSSHT